MSDRPRTALQPLRAPLPPAPAPLPFAEAEAATPSVPAAAPRPSSPRILTPRTGWIVGIEQGLLQVDYPGNTRGPLAARSTVAVDARTAFEAAASRRGALLVFEDGDPEQPILIGLHQPPVASLIDLVLEAGGPEAGVQADSASPEDSLSSADAGSRADSHPRADGAAPAQGPQATADGKRVVLEGEEEVTLRCGKASITLRRDGRVVVRGAYVETHASGTNRIKGGSVRIN